MATSDTRLRVIDIVNEVRLLHGYSSISTLNQDRFASVLLRKLNNVIADIKDHNWKELQASSAVTAISSVTRYSIPSQAPVQRIWEISFDNDSRALDLKTNERYRQYRRSGSNGRPRFFTIQSVDDDGNPQFDVHPQPVSAESGKLFDVQYYVDVPFLTINSANEELPFPANVLIQGLHAEAILDQNGNKVTNEYLTEKSMYEKLKRDAINKFTIDTGTDTYFRPIVQ